MYIFRRVFSIFISLFLFVSLTANPTVKYEPVDSENIKLSAVLLSDMHMEGNNTERWGWIGNTLNAVYAADRTPDVLAFAGDNTMNGQGVEWFDFYGFVNRFAGDSKVLVAFGNHDFGNTSDNDTYKKLSKRCINSYNGYEKASIDKVYYSTEVKGYKFIVLGSEENAENTVSVISDNQIEWLKAQLKQAADKNMPAFVINHNLVEGKNGIRSYWDFNLVSNNKSLADTLENAGTKVVYFSGHSHMPLDSDSVMTFGDCTYVNLPCAGSTESYFGAESDNSFGTGCCMEVYENQIVLRFRCFGENRWLEGFDNIIVDL